MRIEMNSISYHSAIKDIGEFGKIRQLNLFLFGKKDPSWKFRLAPSIITRSEAELLGLSVPRFAVRVYLQDGKSFVNARRLRIFRKYVRGWERRIEEIDEESRNGEIEEIQPCCEPAEMLQDQSPIADCLLHVPEHLKNYHVLSAKLGAPYGETPSSARNFAATPYMMNISLGGGICAQAVCFMASVILHEFTTGVFGLAEVSAMAANERLSEVNLSGLTLPDMARYFNQVGLTAIFQKGVPVRLHNHENFDFASGLKAYLRSGIPVILPLDHGLLANHIYKRNKFFVDKDGINQMVRNRHAVIAVGCERGGEEEFLINDPAIFPFMKANSTELAEAGCYANAQLETIEKRLCLPVTPSAVKMPLFDWREFGTTGNWCLGLMSVASILQSGVDPNLPRVEGSMQFENMRLVRLADLPNHELFDEATEGEKTELKEVIRELRIWSNENLDHWFWVQRTAESTWFWDAEKPLDSSLPDRKKPLLQNYPVVILRTCDCEWKSDWYQARPNAPKRKPAPAVSKPKAVQAVQPTLMTSFTTKGMKAGMIHWPARARFAEIYAFMQADAKDLGGRSVLTEMLEKNQGEIPSALDRMSLLARSPGQAKNLAKRIGRHFSNEDVKITSIATFLPEISAAGTKPELWQKAQDALCFLVDLLKDLQELGHPADILEFVAGCRIDGLWPGRNVTTHDEVYMANRANKEQSISRLLERLKPIASRTEGKVHLAVELEPGPLFVLGGWDSLLMFCKQVEADEDLKDTVGLNLDIPHWAFLSGITVEQVRQTPAVYNRIIHGHISDHSKGHFSDNAVQSIHDQQSFKPWIDLICELNAIPRIPGELHYSGFLALEMESCKETSALELSFARLLELLG